MAFSFIHRVVQLAAQFQGWTPGKILAPLVSGAEVALALREVICMGVPCPVPVSAPLGVEQAARADLGLCHLPLTCLRQCSRCLYFGFLGDDMEGIVFPVS